MAQHFCNFAATNPLHPWKTKSSFIKIVQNYTKKATCVKIAQVQNRKE
jgi:hypothetical protein